MENTSPDNFFERKQGYHRALLRLLTSDKGLKDSLHDLILLIESEADGMLGSVLLMSPDRLHLLEGCAPGLPAFYNNAINGIAIGAGAGSCGTAAFTGERVVVEDINTHPYWIDFKAIARSANLQACWSQPIVKNGIILGTFALYYSKPQTPSKHHIHLIEEAAGAAKVLIDKDFSYQLIDEKTHALENADKSAQWKSDFFANMSHEIRTPLNGIIGSLDLLEDTSLNSQQKQWLKIIDFSTSSLLRIIDDILDVSKINGGKFLLENTVFNFPVLLDSISSPYKLHSVGHVELITVFDEQLPLWLEGDPTRLQQILGNLLSNAFKFTSKGKVELSVSTLAQENGMASLLFEVKDTGIGINNDKVESIFRQYEQADSSTTRQFGGSGLGLYICKELVELFDGDIWVNSEPDIGSTFSIKLNLKVAEQPLVIDYANELSSDFSGIHVLLVEDNSVNAKIMSVLLTSINVSLTTAVNGRQAVDTFCDVNNNFDMIFMDCEMPILDGYEATRIIRAWEENNNRVRAPICALTAHAMGEHVDKCILSGMDYHLAKPVTKSSFRVMLGNIFKSQI
ncbi:ATP-binding protein [Dasania marina]|uniref:GAF domain-containing hybrid sensor histidine kinase/response regulator n=1 Tax=Dasania marina TaxID=471499 RepID=UPI0030DA7A77|tara:strand:+ start:41649 stop:43355 length:1707 start_codon:yes stop_codon:yes gene_type:complete